MAESLESYFQLSPVQLWQALQANPRALMNLKGAVAEEHLRLYLDALHQRGIIEQYIRGVEGQPDFTVLHRNQQIRIECKNVESPKSQADRQRLIRVTIDFQKTRNQLGGRHLRYYHRSEFDIVAACLFNRTGRWEFVYARTGAFREHPDFPGLGHLHHRLVLIEDGELLSGWTPDLVSLLGSG